MAYMLKNAWCRAVHTYNTYSYDCFPDSHPFYHVPTPLTLFFAQDYSIA